MMHEYNGCGFTDLVNGWVNKWCFGWRWIESWGVVVWWLTPTYQYPTFLFLWLDSLQLKFEENCMVNMSLKSIWFPTTWIFDNFIRYVIHVLNKTCPSVNTRIYNLAGVAGLLVPLQVTKAISLESSDGTSCFFTLSECEGVQVARLVSRLYL